MKISNDNHLSYSLFQLDYMLLHLHWLPQCCCIFIDLDLAVDSLS